MAITHTLAEEAARCRAQADEFAGRPEQPFLLRLSEAFDHLAIERSELLRSRSNDVDRRSGIPKRHRH